MSAYDYKHLQRYLKSWSKEVVEEAKDNLRKAGKGGGDLENSISAQVINEGDNATTGKPIFSKESVGSRMGAGASERG